MKTAGKHGQGWLMATLVGMMSVQLALAQSTSGTGGNSGSGAGAAGSSTSTSGQVNGMNQPGSAGRESRTGTAGTKGNASLLMSPMMQMLDKMKAVRKTGNPDMDYATLTKIHHQGEIDLARQGISSGQDLRLVTMARLQAAQKENEIEELDRAMKNLGSGGAANQAFTQATDQKLKAMEMDMQNGMNGKMEGTFDRDFLNVMIQHHQDGIDMSQSYLRHAKDPVLRAHAERAIANGKKEIALMKDIMK